MSLFKKHQNVKSIAVLLLSNAGDKFFGFFREIAIAFIFGSSSEYSDYLFLAVFVDAFMAFTGDSALQANLVPRFARLFASNPKTSLYKVRTDALKISSMLTLFNLLILIGFVIFQGAKQNWLPLIIILSVTVGAYIFNSTGMMMLQARGKFSSYAKGAITNSSLAAILVLPFSYPLGVIGLAISRFLSIACVYFIGWRKQPNEKNQPNLPSLTYKDFDVFILFSANFYVMIILFAKLILSFNSNHAITHFTYATILSGILITSVVKSISAVLLRENSVMFNMRFIKLSLLTTLLLSFLLSILFYFFSEQIISLVFKHGAFTSEDVYKTAHILRLLIIPFALQATTMILIQPILSVENNLKNQFKKIITFVFIVCFIAFLMLTFVSNYNSLSIVITMVYSISISIFAASVYFFSKLYVLKKSI